MGWVTVGCSDDSGVRPIRNSADGLASLRLRDGDLFSRFWVDDPNRFGPRRAVEDGLFAHSDEACCRWRKHMRRKNSNDESW